MSAFVYLISQSDTVHKIGVSISPEDRLRSLQTGHSIALRLSGAWEHVNAYKVERAAHILLGDKRVGGEWFGVSVNEARDAIVAGMKAADLPVMPKELKSAANWAMRGAKMSGEKRRAASDAAIAKIKDRWPLPSKDWPTAALLAEARRWRSRGFRTICVRRCVIGMS